MRSCSASWRALAVLWSALSKPPAGRQKGASQQVEGWNLVLSSCFPQDLGDCTCLNGRKTLAIVTCYLDSSAGFTSEKFPFRSCRGWREEQERGLACSVSRHRGDCRLLSVKCEAWWPWPALCVFRANIVVTKSSLFTLGIVCASSNGL